MHSVAEVIDPLFSRTWHECVAIVQAVLSELAPGSPVPGVEDVLFEANGTLSFGFASESGESPVVGLAKLLGTLLEGVEAPGGLLDLVRDNVKEPPTHSSIESFGRALAFYERPNRAADLRGILDRLDQGRSTTSVDGEFERLRERVAGGNRAQSEDERKSPSPTPPQPGWNQRQLRFAGAALALVVLIGFAALRGSLSKTSGSGGLLERAESGVAYAIAGVLNQLTGSRTAAAPAPASGTPSAAADASARPSSARAPKGTLTKQHPLTDTHVPDGRRGVDLSRPGTPPRSMPGPAADAPLFLPVPPSEVSIAAARSAFSLDPPASQPEPTLVATAAPATSVVYSSSDPEVQPPALVRPQLPREPEPGSDTGYFDMVVDEQGNVEQVKLLSPRRLYQERMLVSAAKAWKFRPATRGGLVVKYRVRIPIILSGMP